MPYVTSVERIAHLLSRQLALAHICGPIPAEVQQRLQSLNFEDLESLADELIEFRSLADLTKWLEDHATDS